MNLEKPSPILSNKDFIEEQMKKRGLDEKNNEDKNARPILSNAEFIDKKMKESGLQENSEAEKIEEVRKKIESLGKDDEVKPADAPEIKNINPEKIETEEPKAEAVQAESNPFIKPEEKKVENVENISPEPSLPDAREEIKGKVPADTFKDLSFELKKGYQKPENEALSDFLDSLEESKKKNSLTATVKRFVNFLKEKGKKSTVLDSMQDFINTEKAKRKEGKQKKEAIKSEKIDRIMDGDYRSNEAVAMDESMESARMEKMKEDLVKAQTEEQLIKAMSMFESITNNSGDVYDMNDQISKVRKFFKSGTRQDLIQITRAPGSGIDSTGIRQNVIRVYKKLTENQDMDNSKEQFKQAA